MHFIKQLSTVLTVLLLVLLTACSKNLSTEIQDVSTKSIEELQISSNFNFTTNEKITLNIYDDLRAVYSIYSYNSAFRNQFIEVLDSDGSSVGETIPLYDQNNRLLTIGQTINGQFTAILQVPSYVDNLLLIRNIAGAYSSTILPITGFEMNYIYGALDKMNAVEIANLIAVNEYQQFFTIDTDNNYQITDLPKLPEKDVATVAYDMYNNIVYYCQQTGNKSLYAYYPAEERHTKIVDLKTWTDRMAFNPLDGLLYMGVQQNVYIVDPHSGTILSTLHVNGLSGQNDSGDLAFDSAGQLYLLTVSGLYKLHLNTSSSYDSELIGGISNPNDDFIGGLAIDKNGDLWASTFQNVNGSSALLKYNYSSGSFEKVVDYTDHIMHDLAFANIGLPHFTKDADNDGVLDELDAYPDDPELAFNNYFPGQNQFGSIAFEDLWPTIGDYDFNDLVVNYNINFITNANNLVKKIAIVCHVANVGGSFINGFGIRFDDLNPSSVASVSGQLLTENIILNDANGTESGESATNIIIFDNATLQQGKTIELLVNLNEPISLNYFSTGANLFMFINRDRAREVHLPGTQPTAKFDPSKNFAYVQNNNDPDGNFKNENNLPWAISVPTYFEYTLPGIAINKGYVYFNEWAETSGSMRPDWYKDLPGYRKASNLDL